MSRVKLLLTVLLQVVALQIVVGTAAAQAQEFRSGPEQVHLLELYTSEGCSSCPPADRWLAAKTQAPELWIEFVPVAFHVDYWDYIGWEDRFASAQYSQRQRQYAREYSEPTVYTPGVRYGGYEWRAWRGATRPTLQAESVGELKLSADENGKVQASFAPSATIEGDYRLNLAVLGMDLQTAVKRGENRGKQLEHQFVVLALSSSDATLSKDGVVRWQGALPKHDIAAQQYALAAWVSSTESLRPIQALGGELPQ